MKFIHLSDLHLGKRVNEFSMLEDQEYILREILGVIDAEAPQAVIIAGDVYDKSVPPAEAVQMFDFFLNALARRDLQVFVISGNHDSPERIAFGGKLMQRSGIHMSPVYDGKVEPITLSDEHGDVNFYLLPFLKPVHVRKIFGEDGIATYTDAVAAAISHMDIDTSARNVLVTHQFVTGAEVCGSEELSVGGADDVDVTVFEPFDYVALGHIHGAQKISRETVRYCGTPLKYSFSEAGHKKSVTVVEMGKKGDVAVRTVLLKPLRDLRELKGSYAELTLRKNYDGTAVDDYLHITLTDEEDIPDAIGRLRAIYKNIMKLDYDNSRTRATSHISAGEDVESKTPFELFGEFYEKQNGRPMSETQSAYIEKLIENVWEGEP